MNKGVVYVLCPAKSVTGGPDALHQMVYYLNLIGIYAKIAYITEKSKKDISIPEPYKIYLSDFLLEDDIIDSSENFVVIPEDQTRKRKLFKNAKIVIWWLSVDNNSLYDLKNKFLFLSTLPLRIMKNWWFYKNNTLFVVKNILNKEIYSFKKEPSNIIHICASYYAFDYVSRKSKNNVFKCIEPISNFFLNEYNVISSTKQKNVILYNPKRKYENILKKISSAAPELQFEPLQGLTQQQLIEKYKTSKLYIDFGAFPGAERIPKEAVLFGCAIITGRRGASNFHGDVPIPDEYKFENPTAQIDEIVAKIRYVLDNYEKIYSDFDEYRETVLNLEDNFIKSLKEIFGK